MNAKQGTKIEWTHHKGFTGETWNPVTGCTKVSPGCANCYAEKMAERLQAMGTAKYKHGFQVACHPEELERPLKWSKKKPRSIFVCSMGDLFHEDVSFVFIASVFSIMKRTPWHRYMVLTKRPERMVAFFEWVQGFQKYGNEDFLLCIMEQRIAYIKHYDKDYQSGDIPYSNIWLGVTAENQEQADIRLPLLLKAPAVNRFVSIEPMLGPINLQDEKYQYCLDCDSNYYSHGFDPCPICGSSFGRERSTLDCLDWVILGGESGSKARRMNPEWATDIKQQCKESNVPFFFKQWGKQQKGSLLDGEELKEFPQQDINAN